MRKLRLRDNKWWKSLNWDNMLDDLDSIEGNDEDWYNVYNILFTATIDKDAYEKYDCRKHLIVFPNVYH